MAKKVIMFLILLILLFIFTLTVMHNVLWLKCSLSLGCFIYRTNLDKIYEMSIFLFCFFEHQLIFFRFFVIVF